MKLLLIEDDKHVALVLAEAFASDGHETAIRYTGEDGLAYLTRARPDAVVLDVLAPARRRRKAAQIGVIHATRHHHDGLATLANASSPSRRHRDHRKPKSCATQRGRRRVASRDHCGRDVEPVAAFSLALPIRSTAWRSMSAARVAVLG